MRRAVRSAWLKPRWSAVLVLMGCCCFVWWMFLMQAPSQCPSSSLPIIQQAIVAVSNQPPTWLLPKSPVFDISNELSSCNGGGGVSAKSFTDEIILPRLLKTKARMLASEFVCEAQCKLEEPELESSLRYLGGLNARVQAKSLIDLCERRRVPALMRILATGEAQWTNCNPANKRVKASHQFFAVQRALFVLANMVHLPLHGSVVFALDTSDFSRPNGDGDPHGLNWMFTEPGVVRFVGDSSHPTLLWPTPPYVRQTAYCDFDKDMLQFAWLKQGPCAASQQVKAWGELKDAVFWRGSPTGYPIDDLHSDFMPRSMLNRRFANKPGYDVGFAEDAVPPYANANFKQSHTWLPRVSRDKFREYKMTISLDGHTASWGLIERLGTGNLLLAVDSIYQYREFYYKLLIPWKHYIPVSFDLSNMDAIREWVLSAEGSKQAEQIASEAQVLVKQRMRPEDLWCYLFRLLSTLATKQDFDPSEFNDKFRWVPITPDSIAAYKTSVQF